MNERAFRLDFYIAIGALVVSILTMATLVYQTRVIEDQYSAAIWPYVELGSSTTASSFQLSLTNNGLGPALVRSAQLTLDDKPVSGWGVYESTIIGDQVRKKIKGDISFNMVSLDRTTAIRPSETMQILSMRFSSGVPLGLITHHKVMLDVCYCSLNGRCWRLRDASNTSPGNLPIPVEGCPTTEHINAV